jgi:hypothetical protein
MPLDWSEIEALLKKRGTPQSLNAQWNLKNGRKRLDAEGDLWGGRGWKEAKLEPAVRKAQKAWLG